MKLEEYIQVLKRNNYSVDKYKTHLGIEYVKEGKKLSALLRVYSLGEEKELKEYLEKPIEDLTFKGSSVKTPYMNPSIKELSYLIKLDMLGGKLCG